MARLAILPHESANRVYGSQVLTLLSAELLTIADHLETGIDDVCPVEMGSVPYLTFEAGTADDPPGDADRFLLSNLSGTRALFRVCDDRRAGRAGGPTLEPLSIDRLACFDDDLVTTQRYPGKTNEQFTHLLVNVGVAASDAARRRAASGLPVRILDPVAGRGTTLNRALLAGYDATGIEVAEADVDQYRTFLTTYLRGHRVKHRLDTTRVRKGPAAGTSSFTVTIRGSQRCEMIRADTTDAALVLKQRSADVIVADLPYGVQHRAAGATAQRRSPGELLDAALPGWRASLRRDGAIVLAWNLLTLPRADVEELLTGHGFVVVPPAAPFEHVVDRSITRDLIVARAADRPGRRRDP